MLKTIYGKEKFFDEGIVTKIMRDQKELVKQINEQQEILLLNKLLLFG